MPCNCVNTRSTLGILRLRLCMTDLKMRPSGITLTAIWELCAMIELRAWPCVLYLENAWFSAVRGWSLTIRILLHLGCSINASRHRGRARLSQAAGKTLYGHEDVSGHGFIRAAKLLKMNNTA